MNLIFKLAPDRMMLRPQKKSGELKVLFVEDDQDHYDYFSHLLSKIGFDLDIGRSTSLREFSERLTEEGFDLILLDMGLPDSSGLDTVERVLGMTETPVVILSAAKDNRIARDAIRFGAQDFLVKSEVTRHRLSRALLYAVDRLYRLQEVSDVQQFSSEFLRTVSHDLRAPLARISNLAQLVSESLPTEIVAGETEEFLHDLESESEYLSGYIQHLYGFCKGGTKRSDLQTESVSLMVPLMRALDVLARDLDASEARVCVGYMPVVVVDESLLSYVFQNLIGNSLKYSGKERPAITIEAVMHPSKCVVTVSDNGVGVPADDLDRVFEPFYRSGNRGAVDGSGVGLAFCKKVVNCHGGRIWASSSEGHGCTISFTLPVES